MGIINTFHYIFPLEQSNSIQMVDNYNEGHRIIGGKGRVFQPLGKYTEERTKNKNLKEVDSCSPLY